MGGILARQGNCNITHKGEVFMIIYEFNDNLDEFEEIELHETFFIPDLLIPMATFLFIDDKRKCVWLWFGRRTTIRDKFVAARISSTIRNRHGIYYKIKTIDQGYEPQEFKEWLGLVERRHVEVIIEQEDDPLQNIVNSIKHLMICKAKAYRYWTLEGDSERADECYLQWIVLCQLCDALGIPYQSIMEEGNDEAEKNRL